MKKVFDYVIYSIRAIFKKGKASGREPKHWSTEKLSIDNKEHQIEEDIINIPECQENLNKFKDNFIQNRFVSFIGAGTSHLTGIPEWPDLIKDLCKTAGIKFEENDNLYKKASEAKSTLKKQGRLSEYYKCLENEMKGVVTHGSEFHTQVVRVFNRHITTNFDLKVYNYYKKKAEKGNVQSLPALEFEKFRSNDYSFVFLHGNIKNKFVILEEEVYNHYYPNVSGEWGSQEIKVFLKNVYKEFSIVFLGTSFNDKYLLQTFIKIASDLVREEDQTRVIPSHFLIVDEAALGVGNFNLIDLKRKIRRADMESIKRKLLKEGYIDDQDNFKIEKFLEFLKYRDSDKAVETYLQNFGSIISDWFKKFEKMKVLPIVYRKGAHRFVENILSIALEKGKVQQ